MADKPRIINVKVFYTVTFIKAVWAANEEAAFDKAEKECVISLINAKAILGPKTTFEWEQTESLDPL